MHFGVSNFEKQHKEGTCKVLGRSVVFSAFYADFCFCSKLVIITTLKIPLVHISSGLGLGKGHRTAFDNSIFDELSYNLTQCHPDFLSAVELLVAVVPHMFVHFYVSSADQTI